MPVIYLDRPEEDGATILQPEERTPYDECQGDAVRMRHCRRASSIVRKQGVSGKVNDSIPLMLLHRENVERFGQDGQTVYDAHQISFNAEDGKYIRPKHRVVFNGISLQFKTPLARDKYGVQTWLCI